MKCSVFIATSIDGYIATEDGNVDWLEQAGNQQADMSDNPDMGFNEYINSVDCMIMGRKCMEKIASFNLTDEQWPYGKLPIYVLSRTMTKPPQNLVGKVEMVNDGIEALLSRLELQGLKHAYIDGGATICAFINLQLIERMIITQAPVVLGKGISLFNDIKSPVSVTQVSAQSYPNDFVQVSYRLSYA
ncbi:dihydrofolate reductase [Shewanella sp. WXL01]|uniref:dihydrofolate reductase family protein n=1 Tax=Shewanella sp. WXL01 TaxID=2709721 RepID=UPI0014384FB0|nr:dihydrofolate reductase family protein [Shewanella sp. WXL01]NKF49290.1 dihydrofolate reductase [Shewanella sp. WXL01]